MDLTGEERIALPRDAVWVALNDPEVLKQCIYGCQSLDWISPTQLSATVKVKLADKYNQLAGKAAGFGLVKKEDANLQGYVTGKSLDGLYLMIGEEERKIRQDPVGSGSAILQKVFGALR